MNTITKIAQILQQAGCRRYIPIVHGKPQQPGFLLIQEPDNSIEVTYQSLFDDLAQVRLNQYEVILRQAGFLVERKVRASRNGKRAIPFLVVATRRSAAKFKS